MNDELLSCSKLYLPVGIYDLDQFYLKKKKQLLLISTIKPINMMKFFKSDSPSQVAAPFSQFWEQIRYPKQLDRSPPPSLILNTDPNLN